MYDLEVGPGRELTADERIMMTGPRTLENFSFLVYGYPTELGEVSLHLKPYERDGARAVQLIAAEEGNEDGSGFSANVLIFMDIDILEGLLKTIPAAITYLKTGEL